MYLHIIDDKKTINHFIRRINELEPDNHQFIVITPSGKWSQTSSTPYITP